MLPLWLFVFTSCCICSQAVHIPPPFPKCALEAPNFSECFTNAVSNAISQLTKPFKSVGLPTVDPIDIESLIMKPRDANNNLNLDAHYTNIKLHGYSQLRVKKVELSKDRKQLVIEGFMPELKHIAHYHMNGTILQLAVHGEGEAEIHFYNGSMVNTFTLEEYEKEEDKYWKVTKSDLKFPAEAGTFNFENLYNDHVSTDMINKMMGEHFKELYAIGVQFYAPKLGEVNQLIANSFFSKVPISNIFA